MFNNKLQFAIIVELSTLKSGNKVNLPIVNIVNTYSQSCDVMLVTDKPESTNKTVVKWLEKNNINYKMLLMRPPKDKRSSDVLKNDMLNKLEVAYNIMFIVDTEDKDVELWRELGLVCLQTK